MRDFFINAFEALVNILIVVMCLGVLLGAAAVAFGGQQLGQSGMSGPSVGLFILIGGGIYVIVVGGLMYLGLGIYQNTKKTAEMIEKLVNK